MMLPEEETKGKQISWKPTLVQNGKIKGFVVLTFRKAEKENIWYFDSGSSRHMTGNKWLLSNVLPFSLDFVTFGDGAKGSVLGLESFNVSGLPKLKDVLLVDGLKANLISISQLCDQDLFAKYTKDKCIVID